MKYAKLIDDFQTKNMRLEKAIKILEDKRVIMYFLSCVSVDNYNFWATQKGAKPLTQEEYELLKEVLEE